MSDKLQKIVDGVAELSVMEVAELVKALEEKFGVTAAAPVAVAAAGGSAGEPVEEQSSFTVILAAPGTNKIGVIKAIREINPSLGLADAKAVSEKPGTAVLENVSKEQAEEAKKKLTDAGATVELK